MLALLVISRKRHDIEMCYYDSETFSSETLSLENCFEVCVKQSHEDNSFHCMEPWQCLLVFLAVFKATLHV